MILINKIVNFLPLRVTHGVKYSCWKPHFIRKADIREYLDIHKAFITI